MCPTATVIRFRNKRVPGQVGHPPKIPFFHAYDRSRFRLPRRTPPQHLPAADFSRYRSDAGADPGRRRRRQAGPSAPSVSQRQRPQPLVYGPALVEDDMRVEGVPYAIDKVIQQPNWDTIDMVKHDGHLFRASRRW